MDGRVVVITGASSGVGRATAMAFARAGCRGVALIARGREDLDDTRRAIEATGARALVLPADVADAQAVFDAADQVVAEFGRLDVWINNAMVTIFSPVHRIAPEEFRRVTEVTYLGQVHGTLAALRHMRPRNHGTIVQVGSALSYRAIPLQAAYCAAKFAVRGFTDSLRCELIHEGSRIRLTMVQLPAVNTPQFDWARNRLPRRLQPVPPIYQPETVAAKILRAARDAPREMWVGLPTVRAIVGTMVAPGLLDRLAAGAAWGGQMTDEPRSGDGQGNLFQAMPHDTGAHGRFDARSRPTVHAASSAWIRGGLAACGILGAVAVALAARAGERERSLGRHR
jgi:NAD(P)-dependent dehydrogenase (short-subunit alcohol dehydrogenase family)